MKYLRTLLLDVIRARHHQPGIRESSFFAAIDCCTNSNRRVARSGDDRKDVLHFGARLTANARPGNVVVHRPRLFQLRPHIDQDKSPALSVNDEWALGS